jgi:hypothetical protein
MMHMPSWTPVRSTSSASFSSFVSAAVAASRGGEELEEERYELGEAARLAVEVVVVVGGGGGGGDGLKLDELGLGRRCNPNIWRRRAAWTRV